MAIYPIRRIGDPVLRTRAKEVDTITEATKKLVKDMFETMYDAPGLGLAAPQVGVSQRIVVIDVDDNPITLINPIIVEKSGTQIREEGCLSIPGERYDVERASFVRVRALNLEGEEFEVTGQELMATALQHELDHLEGILFTDKLHRAKRQKVENLPNSGDNGEAQ